MGRIAIDEETCKGCGLCSTACPFKLLGLAERFNRKGYHPATVDAKNATKCTGCALCARMCPDTAITVYKSVSSGGRDG